MVALIEAVRSVRAEMNVPPSARPPLTLVSPDAEARARLARNRDRLCTLARLEAVREADAAPPGSVLLVAGGVGAALTVSGVIDLSAERARLTKGVDGGEQDAARFARKLANPDFVARAKPEVVEAERQKLADAEATLAKLRAALARLETVG